MRFKELLDKQKKAGKTKDITAREWKPKKVGDSIVGRILSVDVISIKGGKSFNKYIVDTDEGIFTVILGYNLDIMFENEDASGRIFNITLTGIRKSAKDKDVNDYSIEEVFEK